MPADGSIPPPRPPLDDRAASRPSITREDPELARLRVLLAALRPDCADPMNPPVSEPPVCHVPAPRDPMAGWGDVPRGIRMTRDDGAADSDRSVSAIIASVDALPAPAGAVLRWLRGNARASDGVRGVAVSLALALGVDLPDGNLGARRDAAYVAGRRLLWGAAKAWGK